jgi:hypothetical protein
MIHVHVRTVGPEKNYVETRATLLTENHGHEISPFGLEATNV